jgi:allantoin racemase
LGIYDDASERQAAPKIVAVARQAVTDGAKAIFISCAADPAIDAVRDAVSVPVLGAGSAAAGIGLALGARVGVLNLSGNTPVRMAQLLGGRLAIELSPKGVENTTDLLTDKGRQAAVQAAQQIAQVADVMILACTGYTTIGLAAELQRKVDLPIIDAVRAGGAVAKHLLAVCISKEKT